MAAAAALGWRLRFRPSADTLVWRRGAAGERRTARLLAPLERHGWAVLHDLAIPGTQANIDHVVIGPVGCWSSTASSTEDGYIWISTGWCGTAATCSCPRCARPGGRRTRPMKSSASPTSPSRPSSPSMAPASPGACCRPMGSPSSPPAGCPTYSRRCRRCLGPSGWPGWQTGPDPQPYGHRVDDVLHLGKGEPAGYRLVHDAGRCVWIKRVVVDVQVDLIHLASQLLQDNDEVALWPALLPWNGMDGGALQPAGLRGRGEATQPSQHDQRPPRKPATTPIAASHDPASTIGGRAVPIAACPATRMPWLTASDAEATLAPTPDCTRTRWWVAVTPCQPAVSGHPPAHNDPGPLPPGGWHHQP